MILMLTKLEVSDNSGVKYVSCLKIYRKFFGEIGSFISVIIKEKKSNCKYKKGNILNGIIVRTRNKLNRETGNFLFFDSNDVILVDSKNDLIGTRIFGPLPIELRRKNCLKLLSLSSSII